MNRRQLLLRGALVAALSPVVRAGVSVAPKLIAVHDPAYRRSHEFALALQQQGAQVLALAPDALTVWHNVLQKHCVSPATVRLAGLTTYTDYLVLREMARAAGLAPLTARDADAREAKAGLARRATLLAWVLAPHVAA